MEWLWIIQAVLDLVMASLAFAVWKDRGSRQQVPEDFGSVELAAFQNQVSQFEKDALAYRRRMEEQLRYLSDVCEQAQGILTRNTHNGAALSPSMEEEELKAMRLSSAYIARHGGPIPSVQELELRKAAIRPEIPMDLRSLLRDQLT